MVICGALTTNMACPITVVWPMDWIQGSTSAAVVPAIIIGTGNLGGIIGPQIFGISYDELGTYTWAVTFMGFCSFLSIVLATALRLVLKRDEVKREEEYLLRHNKS